MEEERQEPTEEQIEEKLEEVKAILRRKRGGQAGNQNARKHGFYAKVLTNEERRSLDNALAEDGLDTEIGLLRVKIKALIDTQPDNINLIARAFETLAKMTWTRYNMGAGKKDKLPEAMINVFKDIALPAGVALGKMFKK